MLRDYTPKNKNNKIRAKATQLVFKLESQSIHKWRRNLMMKYGEKERD